MASPASMVATRQPQVVYAAAPVARRGGASSAMKARLEEAKVALSKARSQAREKVDAAEAAQLTGALVGSVAHGALRGYGYSEVMGFDVGIIGAAGALLAAQSLPKGSLQRATLYGVGSGMAAAVASEYAEAFAKG